MTNTYIAIVKENWKNIIEYMEEKEDLDNEDS